MVDSPITVLIADDDRISGRILEHHIKSWGYKPYLVHDGEQAWQIFENIPVDIAILDWMMPRVDGLRLCQQIRQKMAANQDDYIYIILLTAKDERADLIRGLNSGADDYITKPFDPLELRARLNTGRRIIELQRLLKKQATHDALTGLLNRRCVLEKAEEEYFRSQRENRPLGLILVDVDTFKTINDTFGHLVGDTILAEVSRRLRSRSRRYDKVGRYGGDEILAVIPNCSTAALQSIAERFRLAVTEKPVQFNHQSLAVSISAGAISTDRHPSLSLQELIALCDRALYQAKASGRNRVMVVEKAVFIGGVNE